jgi:uncharacterized repeat protein (TIGR04076 family)
MGAGTLVKSGQPDENVLLSSETMCNNGTRPVIFKIERIDVED